SASRFTRQRSLIGASSSMTRTRVTPPPGRERSGALYTWPFLLNHDGRRRQFEREPRPPSFRGVDGDAAAHRQHELLRDEEAQARSGRSVAAAIELAEDPLLLGLRDSDSFVFDAELD